MTTRWMLLIVVALGLFLAFSERRTLNVYYFALTSGGTPPPLNAKTDEGPDVRWADDYFTVERIAPATFAIGEPRYAQQNYSYLIVGSKRALLFDAGPGIRDIRSTAESLTDLPITFLPSHFHYDHVGNTVTFDRIAVVDLPYVRARASEGRLTLTTNEHLGMAEGFTAPTWKVDEWLPPGSVIELGDRALTIYHTPGHTTDSISLYDADNAAVFSGDYLYPGYLYGFLPNSSMGDYAASAEQLIASLPEHVTFYGAHRATPPGAPMLNFADLTDLRQSLIDLKAGELEGQGGYPVAFPVNEQMTMLAEPRWLQRWERTDTR